jgi:hypothetical protein
MASLISILGILSSTVGIFFGFYYLFSYLPQASLAIVTLLTVGIVGLLAFVRHVVFHKEDARRLGWETGRPDWIFEVGFANLAFGLVGLLSVVMKSGMTAQALILLGYALYLLQAAILHGYRYFTDEKKSPVRLWRSFLLTLLVSGMMIFFAVSGLIR